VSTYSLSHVSDAVLARDLVAAAARDRASTATLLAHIAEFDARKLYLPAAHSSMYSYCVHELRLCEQAAFKRIRAARTARQYPAIFTAIADGRLHLSAVILLAPYLTPENADELLETAARQNRETIERLLAERFPRPDLPERIEAIPAPQLSPGTVGASGSGELQLSSRTVKAPARQPAADRAPQKLTPLSPQRYALQAMVDQETSDLLRHAQTLLGHQLSSGDIAPVLTPALRLLVRHLECRKFAAMDRPRRRGRSSSNPVHGPQATTGAGGRGRCKAQAGRRRSDPVSQSARFSRRRIRHGRRAVRGDTPRLARAAREAGSDILRGSAMHQVATARPTSPGRIGSELDLRIRAHSVHRGNPGHERRKKPAPALSIGCDPR